MAGRFSTPPRGARVITPSSPPGPEKFEIDLIGAVTGANLGSLKVKPATRLIDVQLRLLAAVGGVGRAYEAHLLKGTDEFDEPFGTPFAHAASGDVYGVVKAPTSTPVYMDTDRKKKI